MPKYLLPVTWESWGVCEIEAESLEEAEKLTKNQEFLDELPLPDGEYVDGSFRVDDISPLYLEER